MKLTTWRFVQTVQPSSNTPAKLTGIKGRSLFRILIRRSMKQISSCTLICPFIGAYVSHKGISLICKQLSRIGVKQIQRLQSKSRPHSHNGNHAGIRVSESVVKGKTSERPILHSRRWATGGDERGAL